MKHTPTPWTLHGLEIRSGDMVVARTTAKGWSVSDLSGRTANAAFIVRAVNAHDELVAALDEMLRWHSDDNSFVAKQARAALAKAKV